MFKTTITAIALTAALTSAAAAPAMTQVVESNIDGEFTAGMVRPWPRNRHGSGECRSSKIQNINRPKNLIVSKESLR
jgi:hypothetical protein